MISICFLFHVTDSGLFSKGCQLTASNLKLLEKKKMLTRELFGDALGLMTTSSSLLFRERSIRALGSGEELHPTLP
jgi:hypothetical protein